MAHNIAGNRTFAGRKSAWHQLGTIREDFTNATQAMIESDQDFTIHKQPVVVYLPDGTQLKINDKFALMREPTSWDNSWVNLGVVSEKYDFFQNREFADLVDLVTEETGLPFSTMGTLGNGGTVFITLDMGEDQINGMERTRYITFVENRGEDGGNKSLLLYTTNTLVVCSNTLNYSQNRAADIIKVKHNAMTKAATGWYVDYLTQAYNAQESMDETFRELARIQLTEEDFELLLSNVIPVPTMPKILKLKNAKGELRQRQEDMAKVYARKLAKVTEDQDHIRQAYEGNMGEIPAEYRGTAWGMYHAVTEYATHTMGTTGTRGRKASLESRAENELFGNGLATRTNYINAALNLKSLQEQPVTLEEFFS
jgi:phage/plasmid-like protein (TIGR03299 family)